MVAHQNQGSLSSTKATAAAIEMLMKEKNTAVGKTQTITAAIFNQRPAVTDDLLADSPPHLRWEINLRPLS
jgi:hypothetical protein